MPFTFLSLSSPHGKPRLENVFHSLKMLIGNNKMKTDPSKKKKKKGNGKATEMHAQSEKRLHRLKRQFEMCLVLIVVLLCIRATLSIQNIICTNVSEFTATFVCSLNK